MKPLETNLGDLPTLLGSLHKEHSVDVLLGAMLTGRGIFLLLFSHRLNRDFGVTVSGGDLTKVLQTVYQFYENTGTSP